MADTPFKQDPRTVVRTSERLWSDVVAEAEGCDGVLPERDPAYEFSNSRRFVQPKPPVNP